MASLPANPAAPASPASAPGIGIGLDAAADAVEKDPRQKDYIIDRVAPGASIQRKIKVQNTTGVVQSVRLYAGSSRIIDGSFVGDNDPSVNELTSWTSIASSQIELAPGEIASDLVTIAVPLDAAEQEHYATIWAEIRSAPSAGSSVAQASRAGIRIYLSVGGGNGPPSDFSIGAVTVERTPGGSPLITTVLTNTGGRALDIGGIASLSDGPGGMSSAPFPTARAMTLGPGETGRATISLPAAIVNGDWTAQLTFTSGLVVHEKTVKLTLVGFEASPAMQWPPITFWWMILLMLVIILLTAIAVYHRRHRAEVANAAHRADKRQSPLVGVRLAPIGD